MGAALLAQALDELRRAQLGFGEVALALMRTESSLLPLGRDLAASIEVKVGAETLTVAGLGEAQEQVVGPLIALHVGFFHRHLRPAQPGK